MSKPLRTVDTPTRTQNGSLKRMSANLQEEKGRIAMTYLVLAVEESGFTGAEEAAGVLEDTVLSSLDALIDLEAKKTILAGGLPVDEHALAFIAEAPSSEELDAVLQEIPLWSMLTWEVIPLQSFKNRADLERTLVAGARK
jgi:muconolactone delta-isomerase